MNHAAHSHCPDCFQESRLAICRHCRFNREEYISHKAANHHLPLFTRLNKGKDNYVLGRVLGEGGFAIVYTAVRERDGLGLAVKEYYPESLASRSLDNCTVQPKREESHRLSVWQKRFEQEGEHLRRCQDYPAISGVVRFADLIKQHNTAYLVMERLQGDSLRAYFTAAKPAEWTITWLKPLLSTLAELHDRQIFHRDISPNNVFLTHGNKPVLMDFGLAREGIRDSGLKSSAIGAGTKGFIAPEQTLEMAGDRVDAKTDLYSLGGLVYMALHGEPPPGPTLRLQGAQLKKCPNVGEPTGGLEKLALHCLQMDRDKRPENTLMIKKDYALLWHVYTGLGQGSGETIVPDTRLPFEPEMVAIKEGSFLMGSPATEPERNDDERQHEVHVEAFEIGKYEVTKGQFKAFVTAANYQTEAEIGDGSYYTWRNPGFEQTDKHPVACVSWNDAQAYIKWLNEKTGKNYSLPTEAQWEYAARAGTTTPFYTGACINTKQANYDGNYAYEGCKKTGVRLSGTQPVGSYPANPWGLYDMAGNIWEWTCSTYASSYDGSEEKFSRNNDTSTPRVLRGGSWVGGPWGLRSAVRFRGTPDDCGSALGFRLSRM